MTMTDLEQTWTQVEDIICGFLSAAVRSAWERRIYPASPPFGFDDH